MKKILTWAQKMSFEKIIDAFVDVAKQYPIAMAIVTIFVNLGFLLVHIGELRNTFYRDSFTANTTGEQSIIYTYNFLSESIVKAMLILVPTFFISLAISRYRRSLKISKKELKNYTFQLLPILFFLIVFSFIDDLDQGFSKISVIVTFLAYISSLALLFLSAKKDKNVDQENKNIYENILTMSINGVFSFIVFLAFFLFGHIIFFSLEKLFGWDIGNVIRNAYVFIAMYIAVVHFLNFNITFSTEKTIKSIYDFVMTKLLFPFFITYALILYAYTAKVLWNFSQWPEGIISYLVICFAFFGVILFIFANNLTKDENTFIQKVFSYFPIFLIPQTAMLLYAIYLRIAEYGITVTRYIVVALGMYLIIFSLYYIFAKEKNLRFIFTSLLGLIIIISFIPKISFIEYPRLSMEYNLKQSLFESGILQTEPKTKFFVNKEKYPFVDDFKKVSDETVTEVINNEKEQSTAQFANYKKIINYTEALHNDYGDNALRDIYPPTFLFTENRWNIVSEAIQSIGLEKIRYAKSYTQIQEDKKNQTTSSRQYFSFHTNTMGTVVDIVGYEKLAYFNADMFERPLTITEVKNKQINAKLLQDQEVLEIKIDENGTEKITLSELFTEQDIEKYTERIGGSRDGIVPEKCFEIADDLKVCFQSISGEIIHNQPRFNSTSGYILWRESSNSTEG